MQKFRGDLTSAILYRHQPLIWVECFDYDFIIKSLRTIIPEEQHDFTRVWNIANNFESNLNFVDEVWVYEECKNGCVVKNEEGKPVEYDEEQHFGMKRYNQIPQKIELKESVLSFVESKDNKYLIARISKDLLASKGLSIIPALQEFVFKNVQKKIEERRSIILNSSFFFEISGLEHICERLTLPLPDIYDIDKELGFVNAIIKRNKNNEVVEIKPDENIRTSECWEGGNIVKKGKNGIYTIKDKEKGLISRDEHTRVSDIMIADNYRLKYPFHTDFVEKDIKQRYQLLVDSLCGMHLYDIREILKSIIAEDGYIAFTKLDKEGKSKTIEKIIMDKKQLLVRNSGLLEMIDYEDNYWKQVADIEALMSHIKEEKKRIDNPDNYPPKFPKPKGILLVGAPGCGKSESAKAIASILNKPLYRLNVSSLLGHKYGQSENRFIEALQTADASAPCVLWIDEIEKAFAGAGNESENDDTLTHIVGHFLTWMQEHKTMVYLVATANDLSRMKPEMLRKGRWDERFYLTYPSAEGCEKILRAISENKMKIKVKHKDKEERIVEVFITPKEKDNDHYIVNKEAKEDLNIIATALHLENKSGAEIENIIVETIVKHKPQRVDGEWVIFLCDIAQSIIENIDYENSQNKFKESECGRLFDNNESDPIKKLKDYNKNKKEDEIRKIKEKDRVKTDEKVETDEKDDDAFIRLKVEKDIQDAKIKNLGGNLPDVNELKKLLYAKYKEQYNFKPASSTNR